MKKILLTFLAIVFFQLLHAQKCWLQGRFISDNHSSHIKVGVDQRNYDGQYRYFHTELGKSDTFLLEFSIDYPQYVKLFYTRNELEVFVEPGDTVQMDIDPMNFTFNSSFKGTIGEKNNILNHYYEHSEQALLMSDRLQFKYGHLWYHTNVYKDKWMREMPSEVFINHLNSWKEKWLNYMFTKMNKNPEAFRKDLEGFLISEINYDWAYHLLIYGSTYSNRHNLSNDFLKSLDVIDLNSGFMASPFYKKYVYARLNQLYESGDKEQDYLAGMIALADSLLTGEIRAWFLSELFIKTLEERDKEIFIDHYYAFLNSTPYTAYRQRLSSKMQDLIPLSVGSPAPSFSLKSLEGAKYSKSDFLSQPVVVGFWASWCRPCLEKMDKLKELNRVYGDRFELVLLNLDESEASWRKASAQYNPPGINLYVPKEEQKELLAAFGVRFLPGLLLLDKDGRFAIPPGQVHLDNPEEWLP